MTRCQYCAQTVEDYGAHLPWCPAVRMAFDDSYQSEEHTGHYRLSETEREARLHQGPTKHSPRLFGAAKLRSNQRTSP